MYEIFLDTETTGLSYSNGDRIVEIACIETQDSIATSKVFHKLINPQRSVPEEAFKIHGFSEEFLSSKETFKEIANEFSEFIKDKTIIIHNAKFDLGFLNNELRMLRKPEIKKEKIIDTLEIARSKFPGTSNSLDALCRRFSIDLSRRTKHNALLDCELLREVYINLLDQKEPKLIFTSTESQKENQSLKDNKIYNKKIIKANNDELDKHKSFLKKEMKKNFY
jgi:DNA polymerase III subunit epsilon